MPPTPITDETSTRLELSAVVAQGMGVSSQRQSAICKRENGKEH
jgi:hypothetical protein